MKITLDKIDTTTKEYQKKTKWVVEYNQYMGSVYRTDMMISSIDCMRKTVKWYKKLFFHTVDICVLNARTKYSTRQTIMPAC